VPSASSLFGQQTGTLLRRGHEISPLRADYAVSVYTVRGLTLEKPQAPGLIQTLHLEFRIVMRSEASFNSRSFGTGRHDVRFDIFGIVDKFGGSMSCVLRLNSHPDKANITAASTSCEGIAEILELI
jgi:hypothetical protein